MSRFWKNLKTILGIVLLVYWTYILVSFTLLNRPIGSGFRIELHLFWCIKEAWITQGVEYWFFIIGNIGLFLPLGFLLGLFFEKLNDVWKVILIGFAVSFIIEALQIFFKCGLAELDDIFNNIVGCCYGYWLFMLISYVLIKKQDKMSFYIALLSWIVIIGFFAAAALMGQPIVEAVRMIIGEMRGFFFWGMI